MNVKVEITYTDEFDNEVFGVSGVNNYSLVDESVLEVIRYHIQCTLLACGYGQQTVDKLFNGEIL